MNAQYLLDAIGLIDDDLVAEAEEAVPLKKPAPWRRWASMAACLALVVALSYGVLRLVPGGPKDDGMSGGGANSSMPADSAGAEADGSAAEPGTPADETLLLMVDGRLYRATDTVLPGEVAEEAILGVTVQTDFTPEADGQSTFAPAPYAMTADGLVVEIGGEWTLFEPVN